MTTAWFMTYIQPAKSNCSERRSPARDQPPHGVRLVRRIVPQTWTITMLDDAAHFELTGSATGPDGRGNAKESFTSDSGQIQIDPDEWRRPERNRKGDRFTWQVNRAAKSTATFPGEPGKLPNHPRSTSTACGQSVSGFYFGQKTTCCKMGATLFLSSSGQSR